MSIDLGRFIFIDQHAHSILKGHMELDAIAFRQCLSESRSVSVLQDHLPASVYYLDLVNQLCTLFGVSSEEGLLSYRLRQPEGEYLNRLWDDVSIGGLIIDDGFRPREMLTLGRLSQLCGRPVFRCLRIESVLEEALSQAASFNELAASFQKQLVAGRPPGTVALKTIAAYRGGLELEMVTGDQARNDFDRAKNALKSEGVARISRCPLYHYFLLEAFELAASERLPVQLHTGIGDDDADLRECNPLCLRPVMRSSLFANTGFVLLHCYPYIREAAYLAAIYPNVYMDLSLAISLVSPLAEAMLIETLSAAPTTKILAGSDGHSMPETHWYGVICWKRALEKALSWLTDSGFLSEQQALDIAGRILHENARKLYALEELA